MRLRSGESKPNIAPPGERKPTKPTETRDDDTWIPLPFPTFIPGED